jgi:DNA-3-methyladenine glycosylase
LAASPAYDILAQIMSRLMRSFFAQETLVVARALLGQRLVRMLDGRRLSGLICEVEAYTGPTDQASHAYHRTPRSAIMYGLPGFAYVYFIYGTHFCLNVVAKSAGQAAGAVLFRGLVPDEGRAVMVARRRMAAHLTDGPGKLCQALGIERAQNGLDLTASDELWLETGIAVPEAEVRYTPRIGVRGDEETKARPWRMVWQYSPVSAGGPTGGPY